MTRRARALVTLSLVLTVAACGPQPASDLTIEALPAVAPNLPEVPTIPPPPHPLQYADSSYSVFGLRHRMAITMGTDVEVTGYIVEIYAPPECPTGQQCPTPLAPHMWIADTPTESDQRKRLRIVGYAENQAQIDEAIEQARRGRTPELVEGQMAIPVDFAVGAKIKLQGRFARISGAGFNQSDGLLDYRGHTILEPAPGSEPPAAPTMGGRRR